METIKKAKTLLVAFIDGLKPTSIQHMPFLSSLSTSKRLKTDLGYSITCHASMYTGVYPEKHHLWFVWQYSPLTSPFRWLPDHQIIQRMNSLPVRYALGKMTNLFSTNSSFSGNSIMKKSNIQNWRYFDLSEKKLWDQPGYIEDFPTVFDILRKHKVNWESVGLLNNAKLSGSLTLIKSYEVPPKLPSWIYLFIGDVDHVSHTHGQESREAINVLLEVDHEIERVYLEIKKISGEDPFFFCFSDHGHMKVENKFDIYDYFQSHGLDLDHYIHIIDANFARFWFRDLEEESQITELLSKNPLGHFLSAEEYVKYHVRMPDNRYGDAIFYLDTPNMFKKTVWGYGTRTVSIHGYLPDYPEKDGVFISNIPVKKETHVELVDILPSMLNLLDIDAKEYKFDGESLW